MTNSFHVRRLTIGTIFKLVAIGTSIPIIGFSVLCGILALNGMQTVTVNGSYVTGGTGLVAALIIGPLFWLIMTVIFGLGAFISLWLFSLARPLRVGFVPVDSQIAS